MSTVTSDITNTADIIDSRDVIDRIAYLESRLAEDHGCIRRVHGDEPECPLVEYHEELPALQALAEEASQYCSDWEYGATLIADHYFEEFAEEEAESTGAIGPNATNSGWPLNHIDWEAAADELKNDYTEVDFDGASYWIRG